MSERWLINPLSPVQDTLEQLRRHILWLLLIRIFLFTLLITITAVLETKGRDVILPNATITMAFLSVVFIYSIGSAALLQTKTRHIRRFGLIQLLSDTLFTALLVLGTGSSQSIFPAIFIFPVIAGGLNLHRIGGLIAAAWATLLYGSVLTCEYLGYIPKFYADTHYIPITDPLVLTNLFAVYGLTFFTVALLSSMLAGRLRSTEETLTRTSLQFDRLSELYKQIFDDISTGIITINDTNEITSYNNAAEKISGFPLDEIISSDLDVFFPGLVLVKGEHDRQVADLKKKDGKMIRVEYSFSRLNLPEDPLQQDAPLCDNCKVITMRDISRLEKMEQKVRDAEKMAAVGELSAAIAHDFRNPLAAISGSAQILAMDMSGQHNPDSTSQSLIEIVLRESSRMEKTITEFLQFARPCKLNLEWFDLRRIVNATAKQFMGINTRYQTCNLSIDIPENLDCRADSQKLQTVLIHLLENSCVASAQTSKPVVIKAREKTEDTQSFIRIQVIDQGTGIAKEIRQQIFTPFYSTRVDSTGLGLAIVRQIVDGHKGTITIPELEDGCLVQVDFPLPLSEEDDE